MSAQLDQDALDTLTPEEREAIEAADDDAPAPAPDDADDDDTDEDAPPVEGEGAKPSEPADAAKAEPEPEPEEPEPLPKAEAPRYEAQLPGDYDDQIKALKSRDAELRQRYKDGEIDIDERDAGLSDLTEQRERLLVLRAKAEISQEMTTQTAQSQWQAEINKAIARAAKEDGIDYRKDQAMAKDWDEFVRILASKPEHADKSMDWFLTEAHKRVMALHGVAKAPAAPKDPIADAKAKRKPPVDAMPKTLAQVPGSDGPGDVDSEFADMDALEGEALEEAIGRLAKTNPSALARYMKGR